MKKALLFLVFALMANLAMAVPAYPYPIKIKLADGTTLTIKKYGDEFFSYTTTSDGYQIIQKDDGYYYYFQESLASRSAAGGIRATEPAYRSPNERAFVGGLRSGVNASYAAQCEAEAQARRLSSAPVIKPQNPLSRANSMAPLGLVVLVQYSDVKFTSGSVQSFKNMLNQVGYSLNGATGCASEYYSHNSFGAYQPTFDVSPIVTLDKPMAYYGANVNDVEGADIRPREMVVEACRLAAAAGVDFSKYDTDGDGNVDNVFVFYAGYDEAEGGHANTIWPHRWVLNPGGSKADLRIMLNGKTVNDYACTAELKGSSGGILAGIGTFAHEFSHVLGLLDFYDTDGPKNGESVGLYQISIMCSGSYNNGGNTPPYYTGIERNLLGWNSTIELEQGATTINPIHTREGNNVYKISTPNPGEYFLLESRRAEGWDAPLAGSGLLVYHIDRSQNSIGGMKAIDRWGNNTFNCYASHPCARLIESHSYVTEFRPKFDKLAYPGGTNKTTIDNLTTWSGTVLPVVITEIASNNGVVTFKMTRSITKGTLSGEVTDANGNKLAGVSVTITKAQLASAGVGGGLSLSPASSLSLGAASSSSFTVTTDLAGRYSFTSVGVGTYSISFTMSGYAKKAGMVEIVAETTTFNATMDVVIEKLRQRLAWYNWWLVSYLTIPDGTYLAARWDAADLEKVRGKNVSGISFETGQSTTISFKVLVDGQVRYTNDVTSSFGAVTVVSIPRVSEFVIDGKSISVEAKFERGGQCIGMDGGPAVENKGNLFSSNGQQWTPLSASGIGGNTLMALLYDKGSSEIDTPIIELGKIGQRDASVIFKTSDGNIARWECAYAKEGDKLGAPVNLDSPRAFIDRLDPKTTYKMEVTAIYGEKRSAVATANFTTTSLQGPYPAIVISGANFTVGQSIKLSLVNLSATPQKVTWRWEGKSIPTFPTLTFDHPVQSVLECEIEYANGKVETLRREIIVS